MKVVSFGEEIARTYARTQKNCPMFESLKNGAKAEVVISARLLQEQGLKPRNKKLSWVRVLAKMISVP
jgi:hypothetical protein